MKATTCASKGMPSWLMVRPSREYTFEQGYYWLMGDNRHSSADSRYWGFVPEDHVVGPGCVHLVQQDERGPARRVRHPVGPDVQIRSLILRAVRSAPLPVSAAGLVARTPGKVPGWMSGNTIPNGPSATGFI